MDDKKRKSGHSHKKGKHHSRSKRSVKNISSSPHDSETWIEKPYKSELTVPLVSSLKSTNHLQSSSTLPAYPPFKNGNAIKSGSESTHNSQSSNKSKALEFKKLLSENLPLGLNHTESSRNDNDSYKSSITQTEPLHQSSNSFKHNLNKVSNISAISNSFPSKSNGSKKTNTYSPKSSNSSDDDFVKDLSSRSLLFNEKYSPKSNQIERSFISQSSKQPPSNLSDLDPDYNQNSINYAHELKESLVKDSYKLPHNNCKLCFSESFHDNEVVYAPSVPVVAIGNLVYLSLPTSDPLTDGQCTISPIDHDPSGSSLNLDNSTWDEIRNFQKSLTLMFHNAGYGTIFMETTKPSFSSKSSSSQFTQHVSIDCFPIPYRNDLFKNSRIMFKHAILSSDEDWSVHNKLIDTSVFSSSSQNRDTHFIPLIPSFIESKHTSTGGFRKKMSSKVPYFHVWFDLDGGYGHVIENPNLFPQNFGLETVASILKLPKTSFHNNKRSIFSKNQMSSAVNSWKSQFSWSKYDWTSLIN
ncbi:Pre-mRNA-splicing factor cwf19 [Smittium mucronatum]|uniref:Pre-mRNA-splicing factor cwf19 n=1 Tax=Smittium mucronatum TaxID=133383 RepID=A0A1R0GVG4_9FUNG|nr:Pre-mRNA-splicing factor cwf19 [Smittium mucronatum]